MTKRIVATAPTPIGSQLRSILIEELQSGRFSPGGKIPSERDLARRYSVSRASVRDSLARLISEGLLVRAGVRGTFVADRIPGYATSAAGTRNVAFLANRNVLEFFQFRYNHVLAGIGSELRANGFNLVLHSIDETEDRALRESLAPGGKPAVDGCIIGGKLRRQTFHVIQELALPVILVDRGASRDVEDAFSIRADYFTGTRLAIHRLHEAGHRDIGFIGFADSQKYRAYCQALKELRIPYEPDFVDFLELFDLPPAILAGYQSLQAIHARAHLPTALLVTDDVVAIGVMEALQIAGIGVPDRISVVCFDDLGQSTTPPLARIRFDREAAGRLAASTMMSVLAGRPPERKHVLLPVEFVPGRSIAAVNSR